MKKRRQQDQAPRGRHQIPPAADPRGRAGASPCAAFLGDPGRAGRGSSPRVAAVGPLVSCPTIGLNKGEAHHALKRLKRAINTVEQTDYMPIHLSDVVVPPLPVGHGLHERARRNEQDDNQRRCTSEQSGKRDLLHPAVLADGNRIRSGRIVSPVRHGANSCRPPRRKLILGRPPGRAHRPPTRAPVRGLRTANVLPMGCTPALRADIGGSENAQKLKENDGPGRYGRGRKLPRLALNLRVRGSSPWRLTNTNQTHQMTYGESARLLEESPESLSQH